MEATSSVGSVSDITIEPTTSFAMFDRTRERNLMSVMSVTRASRDRQSSVLSSVVEACSRALEPLSLLCQNAHLPSPRN